MRILGLDGAAAKTGVVIMDENEVFHESVIKAKGKDLKRAVAQSDALGALVQEHSPEFAVIEGYGLAARNKKTLLMLIEAGTLMRAVLWHYGIPWLEIAPKALKRFATGRGGSAKSPVTKPQMAIAAKEQYGYTHRSHDVIDAYWLARVGLGFKGKAPLVNSHQREVASKLQIRRTGR